MTSANMRGDEDRWTRADPCDTDRATQARCGGGAIRRKPDASGSSVGRQSAQPVSLARAVPAWRVGSVGCAQAWWAPTQARWRCTALDLPHPIEQEPAATEVSVRA